MAMGIRGMNLKSFDLGIRFVAHLAWKLFFESEVWGATTEAYWWFSIQSSWNIGS